VNKTLYIPLYGKAQMSKKGMIQQQKKFGTKKELQSRENPNQNGCATTWQCGHAYSMTGPAG
jgi:hypothetical protein